MRDCYSVKLGDGMMEHHDYGFVTYQRYGEWYDRCEECNDLAPEDYTSNHDGLCDTCYRQKHACDYCGDFSLDLEDFDGDKLCPECIAITAGTSALTLRILTVTNFALSAGRSRKGR